MPPVWHNGGEPAMNHVSFVDEKEWIGCDLCMLVCPVPDCINMVEVSHSGGKESWKDRTTNGSS